MFIQEDFIRLGERRISKCTGVQSKIIFGTSFFPDLYQTRNDQYTLKTSNISRLIGWRSSSLSSDVPRLRQRRLLGQKDIIAGSGRLLGRKKIACCIPFLIFGKLAIVGLLAWSLLAATWSASLFRYDSPIDQLEGSFLRCGWIRPTPTRSASALNFFESFLV